MEKINLHQQNEKKFLQKTTLIILFPKEFLCPEI